MLQSPPSRRRGLKFPSAPPLGSRDTSPPSRRRGLKFDRIAYEVLKIMSPPSRRRGLKFLGYLHRLQLH